jgi:dienelactone hydrolase/tRNA A-37 threonylcarbamoyl transferase component Bud32
MSQEVPPALVSSLEGRYVIEGVIGRGGMATVYRATDKRHNRPVAIKVLHPELSAAVTIDRFLREIAIGARLQHPHILTLIDSGEAGGLLYYVMPFVEGESLRDKLGKHPNGLPVAEVHRTLVEVVDALEHAHKHGLVHRDVKPENILLRDRHAMVVDFGVARALRGQSSMETLTQVGITVGTPAYMAPEQAAGDANVDHRADIYAVGVVAYEMLCGHAPFSGPPEAVIMAHVTREAPHQTNVSDAWKAIVSRCMAKDPAARYQSATDLLAALDAASPSASEPRRIPRAYMAGAGIAALVLLTFGVTYATRTLRERRIRDVTVPEIVRLIDASQVDSAFVIQQQAIAVLPRDSALAALDARLTAKVAIHSVPEGATVEIQRLVDSTTWTRVGTTPTDSFAVLRGVPMRVRITKPGFNPILTLRQTNGRTSYPLDSVGTVPEGMAHIPAGLFGADLPGVDHLPAYRLGDFLMDVHEVTNAKYREFVRAGGYSDARYWVEPMTQDGRRLPFDEAMKLFRDRTGRPGPATWEAGDFAAGHDDYPVTGVSWFEAAAYARFVGKSLPSVYHWARAAVTAQSQWIVPTSNLNRPALARGSTVGGLSPMGVFDLAGNVREWCQNSDGRGSRFILGGGWSDALWAFNDAYAQGPFDRSAINGIRLVKYLHTTEPEFAKALGPLAVAYRDYAKEKPVSAAEYAVLKRFYDYDYTPPRGEIISRDTTPENWTRETVTYDAGYNNERVPAYLFLPKRARPPYQTVVVFPGDGGFNVATNSTGNGAFVDFLMKSGRAVLMPVYKGTYERRDSTMKSTIPNMSAKYRDYALFWSKDLRRGIDYLSTRADIDTTSFVYVGLSWGGRMGGLYPAIEPRIKTVILYVAGLRMQRPRPEADPFNFLSHITQPVLMLNGRYDYYFPTETSQKPFFEMLGTPADRKRYVVYDGGHSVPRTDLIRESLDWLDKYGGAPRQPPR